jgi:hypothetical protein
MEEVHVVSDTSRQLMQEAAGERQQKVAAVLGELMHGPPQTQAEVGLHSPSVLTTTLFTSSLILNLCGFRAGVGRTCWSCSTPDSCIGSTASQKQSYHYRAANLPNLNALLEHCRLPGQKIQPHKSANATALDGFVRGC